MRTANSYSGPGWTTSIPAGTSMGNFVCEAIQKTLEENLKGMTGKVYFDDGPGDEKSGSWMKFKSGLLVGVKTVKDGAVTKDLTGGEEGE